MFTSATDATLWALPPLPSTAPVATLLRKLDESVPGTLTPEDSADLMSPVGVGVEGSVATTDRWVRRRVLTYTPYARPLT
jgi:hypothetical protein